MIGIHKPGAEVIFRKYPPVQEVTLTVTGKVNIEYEDPDFGVKAQR